MNQLKNCSHRIYSNALELYESYRQHLSEIVSVTMVGFALDTQTRTYPTELALSCAVRETDMILLKRDTRDARERL